MQKILIVEDDSDIQDILKNHLIDAGYEVVVASDGVVGIAMFDDTIDLILLDIMLPKIDGWFPFIALILQRMMVKRYTLEITQLLKNWMKQFLMLLKQEKSLKKKRTQHTSKYTRLVLKKTIKLSLSGDTGSDSIIIINKMNLLHLPTFAEFHQDIIQFL